MRTIDDRPDLMPYVLASLLIHILLLLILKWTWYTPEFKEQVVEIIPLFEKSDKPYRIADIEKPAEEKRPKKAKFLGMYDSSAKKETVSIKQKPGKSGKYGKRRRTAVKKSVKKKLKKDKLYVFDKHVLDKGAEKGLRSGSGEGGDSFPHDFYPDFNRGSKTYLNVLRYPGVDYFVRMKRAFKVTFNPVPVLRGYFSNNRVARGSVDVVLGVSVGKAGQLAELFIFRSSGVPGYDEEALRTVRASSPFSTPPKKFLERDGLLRMSWTFTVYL